jgi:MoaA/NifB/PqqE/SkfB family radical SAM enzyme
MTQEDIIKLAREAGLYVGRNISGVQLVGSSYEEGGLLVHLAVEELERFAGLVRAAEREACAKLCLEEANEAYHQEAFYLPRGNQGLLRIAEGAKRCAEAIRARGEK